jgi:hypothetical protein
MIPRGRTGVNFGAREISFLFSAALCLGCPTIYCPITNTDQSGNAMTSAIFQLSETQYVYIA